MGLFLVGLDLPFPRVSSSHYNVKADFVHKQTLLAEVRNLHVVHSSTNRELKAISMKTFHIDGHHKPLQVCETDQLGLMDLQGWTLAKLIIGKTILGQRSRNTLNTNNFLPKLQTLTFGSWDDGRWQIYETQAPYGRDYDNLDELTIFGSSGGIESQEQRRFGRGPGTAVVRTNVGVLLGQPMFICPSRYLENILRDVLRGNNSLKTACYDTSAQIDIETDDDSVMNIVHNARIGDISFAIERPRPTRVYVPTSILERPRGPMRYLPDQILDFGNVLFNYNSQMKPVFRPSRQTRAQPFNLEVCLIPEIPGNAGQLYMAKEFRDALEAYMEAPQEATQEGDGDSGHMGTLKILVGDDIPPCPCCGRRR